MPQPNQRHYLDDIKHKGFTAADEPAQSSVLHPWLKPRIRKGGQETDQRGAGKVTYYIRSGVEFHIRIDIRTAVRIKGDESMSQSRDLSRGKCWWRVSQDR